MSKETKNREVLLRGRTLMPPMSYTCTKCGSSTVVYVNAVLQRCSCGNNEFKKHETKDMLIRNNMPGGKDGKADILDVAEPEPFKEKLTVPKLDTRRKKKK